MRFRQASEASRDGQKEERKCEEPSGIHNRFSGIKWEKGRRKDSTRGFFRVREGKEK